MDSTFKFYSDILDKMINEKKFWRYYFLGPYNMDYGMQIDDDTWFHCGATRGCIVNYNCDEVIKFVFEDGNECENELNIYQAACEVGLDKCFVPCRFLGTYSRDVEVMEYYDDAASQAKYSSEPDDWDDIIEDELITRHIRVKLYAYPRIDDDDGDFICNGLSPEENNFCRKHSSPLTERSFKVGIEFLREYGEEVFYDLGDFCSEWHVNDLHTGNVGYLNGHVVILDYAGYWR